MKTTTAGLDQDTVRRAVRERYGAVARNETVGCGCGPTCCGGERGDGPQAFDGVATTAQRLGYSATDIGAAPPGANLGLGCGNPLALASLKPGQTVLDLGSGAGFDAFLAARAVGAGGLVIGVDMTPDMITKARANQVKGSYDNVEFRLGEIENLPVADGSVDVKVTG